MNYVESGPKMIQTVNFVDVTAVPQSSTGERVVACTLSDGTRFYLTPKEALNFTREVLTVALPLVR